MAKSKHGGGRRRISTAGEDSVVMAVRVPKSWYEAFLKLETQEVKQVALLRMALKEFLVVKKAFPKNA